MKEKMRPLEWGQSKIKTKEDIFSIVINFVKQEKWPEAKKNGRD